MLLAVLTSCKKNNTTNSNNPNTTNPIITNPPTVSSTSTAALVGKWIMKKTIFYDANGLELNYTNYYNANTYYIELKSGNGLNCINSQNGTAISTGWSIIDSTRITLGGPIYNIVFRNTDSLVLLTGDMNNGSVITILSKKLGFQTQRPMEQLLNKRWAAVASIYLQNYPAPGSVTTYTDPTKYYLDLGNLWTSTGNGWNCTLGTPVGYNQQSAYKVINDSIITFTNEGIVLHIDTITPTRLVVTREPSFFRYIFN